MQVLQIDSSHQSTPEESHASSRHHEESWYKVNIQLLQIDSSPQLTHEIYMLEGCTEE